jgi:hypothetical protein
MAMALLVQCVLIQDHQVSNLGSRFGPGILDLCKSKLGQTPGPIWALKSRRMITKYHEEAQAQFGPAYHKDIREVLLKGSYRGVVLGQLTAEASRTRAGTQVTSEWLKENRKSVVERVDKRAEGVLTFLIEGLEEKVYSEEDIIMINHSRKLLNLQSILVKVSTNGSVRVSDQGWRGFKAAAQYFEPEILRRIPEDELRLQYREFNRRLEEFSKKKGSKTMSSIQILGKFLDPKEKLFMNIEGPLSVLARASVTKGVEAIVESWVSVMENHSNSARGLTDQERLDREMWVAINGPEVAHCEGIVREAVVEVDVSFIRRDSNIKSYDVSKAVDTLVNKQAKVPFLT